MTKNQLDINKSEELYRKALKKREESRNYTKKIWADDKGIVLGANQPYVWMGAWQTGKEYQESFKEILEKKLYNKVKHADGHPILGVMCLASIFSSIVLDAYLGYKIGGEMGTIVGGLLGFLSQD